LTLPGVSMGDSEALNAAEWIGAQLLPDSAEQRASFASKLQELIVERNRGHWYPEEPHRGCAYRSMMMNTNGCDPLILKAAEGAGVKDILGCFCKHMSEFGEVICWINPGEVKVLKGKAQQFIYSDGTGSDNPYEKLRINIKPTKLAVKVDTTDTRELHAPGSPVSSAGGPSGSIGGSEGFGYRWNGHSQGMASSGSVTPRDGASPTESPAESWRAAPIPPAMAPLPPNVSAQYGIFGGHGDLGGVDGPMLSSMPMSGMSMSGMGGMGGLGQPPQPSHSTGASPMRGGVFQPGGACSSSPMIF